MATKKKKYLGNLRKSPLIQKSRRSSSGPSQNVQPAPQNFNTNLQPAAPTTTQNFNTNLQPAPQQKTSLIQRAGEGIKKWFGGTPLGARLTGGEVAGAIDFSNTTSEELRSSAMSSVPIGGVAFKGFGAAAKLSSKEIIKRQAAMLARFAKNKRIAQETTEFFTKKGNAFVTSKGLSDFDKARRAASAINKALPAASKFKQITTKTMRLMSSDLVKRGLSATGIGLVVGAITTAPFQTIWSEDTEKDAINKFTFAQQAARKDEDWETVAYYDSLIKKANKAYEEAWHWLTYFNMARAVKLDLKAGAIVSKRNMEIMEKKQADEAAGIPSKFERESVAAKEATIGLEGAEFDRQRGVIDTSKGSEGAGAKEFDRQRDVIEKYNTMNFNRKKKADEDSQEFWQNYLNQKQANAKQQQAFWEKYRKDKAAAWEAMQSGNLGFGLL